MAIEFEKIKPWDGQTGTGADNRGVIDRNFEKVKGELEENKAEIAQLAGSVKNTNSNYSLINFVNGEIDISGDKITFIRNPLLYNLSTGHRVYLFPQNTSYPHEVTLGRGKLTALPVSVFESTNAASYLPSDSFVEIDYGATTDDLIVLWGRSSSTIRHYLGISTRYTNTLKPPLYDFIDSFKLVTGYTLEQGGITNGVLHDRDDRIRTSFIEAGFLSRIEVPPTYKYFISYYDINKKHLHSTDFFSNSSNHLPVKGAFYVRVVFGDQSYSNLLPETFGEKIYCSPLTAINPNDLRDKRIVEDDAIVMTQGSLSFPDAREIIRTNRIRSGYIAVNYIERLEFNPGFEVAIFSFDKKKNNPVYLDFASLPFEDIAVDGFIRIIVRVTGDGDIHPDAETGLKLTYVPKYALYGTSGVPEGGEPGDVLTPDGWDGNYAKKSEVISLSTKTDFVWESGSVSSLYGYPIPSETRIRTGYIPSRKIASIEVLPGFRFTLFRFDEDRNFLGASNFVSTLSNIDIDGFFRIVVKYENDAAIDPSTDVGLTVIHEPKYAPYGTTGIPEGGMIGDVLTPAGWDGNYAKKSDLSSLATKTELIDGISDKVTESQLRIELSNYHEKAVPVSNIANESVSLDKLTEATRQYIDSAGGGSIINNPDDEDLEVVDNTLKLKGEGVVRFRVKETPAANYNELIRCKSYGLPIQIKDIVDLAHSNGDVRDIDLDGVTLKFVGNGQIKNCQLNGALNIEAGRRKIFDNVYFHKWFISGYGQRNNSSSVYEMFMSHDSLWDVYNYSSKELSVASKTIAVNPFDCSFTVLRIGNFHTPIYDGTNYVYQENGTTLFTFKLYEGKIRLPIRRDYVFTDQYGNVVESTYDLKTKSITYVDIEPENLRVSRLIEPVLKRTATVLGEIYPEWFGVKANEVVDNKVALQRMHLCSGVFNFAPSTYHLSGDVVLYDDIIIRGNNATLKLLPNSNSKCLYEIETRSYQNGITIYDLNLNGNRSNNVLVQDGIYSDWRKGVYYGAYYNNIEGYSFTNTYWYNLKIENFTGSGIACACPGTSHIYSSEVARNNFDGITWLMEHFTLTNVTCWHNGRHGVFTSGNHWRIIGGAYAHNGAGSNIHCDGAKVSQIIGCSLIDSGRFLPKNGGGYAASSQNVYGYIWVGEGQGTHEMVGGDGLFLKDSKDITIVGVRISGANANSINIKGSSARINISNCIFEGANLVKKDYRNIGGDARASARIDNCEVDGEYVVTNNRAEMLPDSTASDIVTLRSDFNALLNSLKQAGFMERT